jgi:hypothetical protein
MNCNLFCCSCSCPPQAVDAGARTSPVTSQPVRVGSSVEQMMTSRADALPTQNSTNCLCCWSCFGAPPPTEQSTESQPLALGDEPPPYSREDPNPLPSEEGAGVPMGAFGGNKEIDEKSKPRTSPKFERPEPSVPVPVIPRPSTGGVGGTGGAGGADGIQAPADVAPLTPLERLRNLLSTFLPTLDITFQYDEPIDGYQSNRQVTGQLQNILRDYDLTGNGLNISVPIAEAINADPALRAEGFNAEVWYLPLKSREGELMNLTDARAAIQRACNHAMVAIRNPNSDVPFLLDVATTNYLSENIMLCGNWTDFEAFIRHKLAQNTLPHPLVLNPGLSEDSQVNYNISIYNSGNQDIADMLGRYFRQEVVNLDALAAGMHAAWYGNKEPSELEHG